MLFNRSSKVLNFISRAPARKVTALNPAPGNALKEQVDAKRSLEDQPSLSGLIVESCDPTVNLMTIETSGASLDKATPVFHLTPLVEQPALPDSGTVGQETSELEENVGSLPNHSAQDATTTSQIESINNKSPQKGVFSAPISASVRDIVASKEEEGLMISGLEEVRHASSLIKPLFHRFQ